MDLILITFSLKFPTSKGRFISSTKKWKDPNRVFPRLFTHGGTSAGGQSVNGGGGLMRWDIDLMGDLTLIDYIIN